MSEVLSAVVAGMFGLAVAWLQRERGNQFEVELKKTKQSAQLQANDLRDQLKSQAEDFEGRIKALEESYRLPVPVGKGEYRNSIMLLGLGNSGKTNLIRTLLNAPDADPSQKTMDYSIYEKRIVPGKNQIDRSSGNANQNRITNFFISDYRRQNVGNLVSSFIFQQKMPNSPMQYGHINSLILIVDAVSVPTGTRAVSQYSAERVASHISQWNKSAIDAVFGMLTAETLNLMCLFINKSDAIRAAQEPIPDRTVIDEFDQLVKILKLRCPSETRFEVIYGSAVSGEGVSILQDWLIDAAVEETRNCPPIRD